MNLNTADWRGLFSSSQPVLLLVLSVLYAQEKVQEDAVKANILWKTAMLLLFFRATLSYFSWDQWKRDLLRQFALGWPLLQLLLFLSVRSTKSKSLDHHHDQR